MAEQLASRALQIQSQADPSCYLSDLYFAAYLSEMSLKRRLKGRLYRFIPVFSLMSHCLQDQAGHLNCCLRVKFNSG